MKDKIMWKIVGVCILFLSLFIGVTTMTDHSEPTLSNIHEVSVTITVDGLYKNKEMIAFSGETILTLLETLDSEYQQTQLVTKEYDGMGTLVIGIGGRMNGDDGKYWHYTVNGTVPLIGADTATVHNGDKIEWKFI